MKNSNENKDLDTILEQLDDDTLHSEIDISLDQTLQNFEFNRTESISFQEFNNIIISLYKIIIPSLSLTSSEMSESEADKDVISILECHYRGNETTGYDGALFDAVSQGTEGIVLILERLVDIIKSAERRKRIYWVVQSNIDPSNWNLRKRLVKDIRERFSYLLHPDLKRLTDGQLVPHLGELIFMIVQPLP